MHVLRCTSCDLMLHDISVAKGYKACCPKCGSVVTENTSLSFSSELAVVFAAFALFFPAQFFPLISIDLLGVPISTTIISGSMSLLDTFPFVGILIIFCTAAAPLIFLISIITSIFFVHTLNAKALYYSTYTLKLTRYWVMIDVFLVSLAVASFKVQEIAHISVGSGLFSFFVLQILFAILLSRVSPNHYWDVFSRNNMDSSLDILDPNDESLILCTHCGLTQQNHQANCSRCGAKLEVRSYQSIQKTWAALLAAIIFIFPANLYPISVLLSNGKRMEDTIFSGVATLIKTNMYGIAIIIFTASIIVPVAKIIGLTYILICIQFKIETGRQQRMNIYRFVKWIGKWSMMDLCVISIMVSLIDRGQLLDFMPGPGAIAFGLVVVLTITATESLDSRLIWDKYE